MGYFDEINQHLTDLYYQSGIDRETSSLVEASIDVFEEDNPEIDTSSLRLFMAKHRAGINAVTLYSVYMNLLMDLIDTDGPGPIRLNRATFSPVFYPQAVSATGTDQAAVMVAAGFGPRFFGPSVAQDGYAQLIYNNTTALAGGTFNLGQSISVQLDIDPGSRTVQGVVWKINGTVCRDDDIDAPYTLRYNDGTITFGADFNGQGPGNTGTVFTLGLGSHTFLAEIAFTDTSTSSASATVTVEQITVPPPSSARGLQPDGSVTPPGVPAYSTPATRTCSGSVSSINAALSASVGGDVIEVTTDGLSGQKVDITGEPSSASPSNRVLIRPPIGQRWSANEISLHGRNICLAGYNTSAKIGKVNTTGGTLGDGSGFWRCGKSTAGFRSYDVTDGFFYECFSRDKRANVTTDVSQVQQGSVRFVYAYCWFNECWPVPGTESEYHTDGIQYTGSAGDHWDPTIRNCVIWGGSNAAVQGRDFRGTFTVTDNEFGERPTGSALNLQCQTGGAALILRDNTIAGSLTVESGDPGTWSSETVAGNVATGSYNTTVNPSGNTWNTGVNYETTFTPFDASWPECPF